jgi:hypothetical protein
MSVDLVSECLDNKELRPQHLAFANKRWIHAERDHHAHQDPKYWLVTDHSSSISRLQYTAMLVVLS